MKIILKKINELIPYVNNSRTHSDKQILQIASSIKEFGFTNPVLIDKNSGIIAGHGRILGAAKLGLEEIPCIALENLSKAQQKAYIIADNKLALNADWNEELLRLELEDLKDLDFDLSLLGFDNQEIDELTFEEIDGLTDEDDLPELTEEPKSKLGDVYQLGSHRLMCGDSTDSGSVALLMNGAKADMVFTDPPYLMDFQGGLHGDGTKSYNAKHGVIKNDKISKKDGEIFIDKINTIIKDFVRGAFYITFYRLGIDLYYESLKRVGLQCRSLIIWNKGNHTLSNSDYMSNYEPIFYGWVNEHIFYGGKKGMDIWDISRTKKNDLHPTMKPVELCEKAIADGSKKTAIVLDLFGGSGSTMIACEKKKRNCYMMELEPKYIDVIIKRWEDFTGKKAELINV